jgi:hypothetical protein
MVYILEPKIGAKVQFIYGICKLFRKKSYQQSHKVV